MPKQTASPLARRSSRLRDTTSVTPDAEKDARSKKQKKDNSPTINLEDDDAMSVDTATANNASTELIATSYVTFLSLQVTVPPSKKGTETMREAFRQLFKILQEADKDAAMSFYKESITYDDKGFPTPANSKYVIESPDDIPLSVTAIGKYFFGARPNSKGGAIWTQIRLIHNVDIDTIIADTKDDFSEKKGRLSKQTIQHWDVECIGFLKNNHPDIDVSHLESYFIAALQKLNRNKPLLLGLKVKTPWDGKKRDPKASQVSFRNRVQAIHCECEGAYKSVTGKLLKSILASTSFQARYRCDTRLVPTFDRHASPYIQDKIKRCILQHDQFCKCVSSNTCEGIQSLDSKNTKLKKTLRQLILELPDAHFINIDLNWSNTGYSILFPKKYEVAAQERIANLGPYLHKAYGDNILPSLSPSMQEEISEVTWDKETGRPLTKLDRELDDILEGGTKLDYVDLSIIKDDEPDRPVAASNTFIPQLDNASISTFGTVKSSPKKRATASLPRTDSSHTIVSEMTMETLGSRVSMMETNFGEMKQMLSVLVANQMKNVGTAASPTNNASADASKTASALEG